MKPVIAIVDDSEELAKSISEILEIKGLKSVYFESPELFLDYVKHNGNKVDLIVTDYHMPKLNGLAMMEEVHKSAPIPFMLMSADFGEIDFHYSTHHILNLDKPIDSDWLARRIREFRNENLYTV